METTASGPASAPTECVTGSRFSAFVMLRRQGCEPGRGSRAGFPQAQLIAVPFRGLLKPVLQQFPSPLHAEGGNFQLFRI